MKEAVYKISSASIVIGLVIFMWFASKDMQRAKMIEQAVTVEKRDESNSKMTEEEAAKAIFYYIYSDYDYNSMVTVGMTSEGLVYTYQTPEQEPTENEMLYSKGLTGDERYYIFAHDTMYRVNAHSYRYDYNYHTDYAVNKETGEVLQERQWVETDEEYELMYSKEYENVITQLMKKFQMGK